MKIIGTTSALAVAGGLAMLAAAAAPTQAATYVGTVIASGLDNPRGLAFGPDGALYIAEAGALNPGGPTTIGGEGAPAAFGTTGAITKVSGGTQTRIITGLPAFTNTVTGAASGPQDIAFYNGTGYFVVGLGTNPSKRTNELGAAPEAANLASLYAFDGATTTKIADLGAYELANNPTGDQIDSNPYHLTAGPGGLLVTDAGGNSLLAVTDTGVVSTVATFPANGGPDVVPTGIAVGPDGAFYVGQLTGFPFTPGSADIFRIDPLTNASTVYATGFTNITDIAWGSDGSLYALQFPLTGGLGSIERLNGDGSHSTIFGGLIASTGLEIGPDGAFYVTQFSASPGTGQVLRIAQVPEPASWAMLILGFGLIGGALRRHPRARVRWA